MIKQSTIILENCRYDGQKGYGQTFDQPFGCQAGNSSSSRHFTQNAYHQDLEKHKTVRFLQCQSCAKLKFSRFVGDFAKFS